MHAGKNQSIIYEIMCVLYIRLKFFLHLVVQINFVSESNLQLPKQFTSSAHDTHLVGDDFSLELFCFFF